MKFQIILTSISLVLFLVPIKYSQTNVDGPLSYAIEKNHLKENEQSGIHIRTIYVKLESRPFDRSRTPRLLAQLFRSIQAQNCYPERLRIYAFDDLEQLRRQISFDSRTVFVDFPNTSEGEIASSKYSQSIGPKLSGYYRAFYDRNLSFEILGFSPEVTEVAIEQIWLSKAENASLTLGTPAICRDAKPL